MCVLEQKKIMENNVLLVENLNNIHFSIKLVTNFKQKKKMLTSIIIDRLYKFIQPKGQ